MECLAIIRRLYLKKFHKPHLKKAGFSKDEIDAFAINNYKILDTYQIDTKKMAKYDAIMNNLQFNFDKVSDLKNGDKVTLTVSCKGNKLPIC